MVSIVEWQYRCCFLCAFSVLLLVFLVPWTSTGKAVQFGNYVKPSRSQELAVS